MKIQGREKKATREAGNKMYDDAEDNFIEGFNAIVVYVLQSM